MENYDSMEFKIKVEELNIKDEYGAAVESNINGFPLCSNDFVVKAEIKVESSEYTGELDELPTKSALSIGNYELQTNLTVKNEGNIDTSYRNKFNLKSTPHKAPLQIIKTERGQCEKYFSGNNKLKKPYESPKRKGIINRNPNLKRADNHFKCPQCSNVFTQKQHLKTHMLIHTGEKPFKCNQCHRAFAVNCNLKTHMSVHNGEKPFKCSHCDKAFTQSTSLKTHMLVHEGLNPFKCHLCDKAFTANSSLKAHLSVHKGGKRFKCDLCDKAFPYKQSLAAHMSAHTGAKPFKCDLCDKVYAHRGSLQDHLLSHKGERAFKCNLCEKDFTRNSGFRRHMLSHSGDKQGQESSLKLN